MRTELSARIAQMQQKLSDLQPVAWVHAETQLFVSSDQVCRKLVTLADVRPGSRVLEPSAGTCTIVQALLAAVPEVIWQCVEMNAVMAEYLSSTFPEVVVTCADFPLCFLLLLIPILCCSCFSGLLYMKGNSINSLMAPSGSSALPGH